MKLELRFNMFYLFYTYIFSAHKTCVEAIDREVCDFKKPKLKAIVWPSEQIHIETIEWLKDHPLLYDKTDTSFYDKTKREMLLSEKVQELKTDHSDMISE